MGDSLAYAIRSVNGVFLKQGFNPPKDVLSKNLNSRTNLVKTMEFSNNGKMLAYCDSERTVCVDTSDGHELFAHPLAKTSRIMFDPTDQLLVCYEPYVIYGTRVDEDGNKKTPNPNLNFIDVNTGVRLAVLIQRNQINWQPLFTGDGQTFVILENSEVHFHDSKDPERFNRKAVIKGVETLKVSPGQDPIFAAFVPSKNEPNLISLRNFHGKLTVISQKTTFNADKCSFEWNSKGNACLATTSVEVDKSNQSYYGVNNVFLLSKTGDSAAVPLNKKGPVHAIQWSPTGNQFTVCYGFMPSKVAVFNLRASMIWDLGESHRNEIYYNTFGTILATCGFGNISAGKIQLWDTEKREEIVSTEVPNTTYFEWAPDGQHFLTCTTSPRMRVDNNFRVWHYGGEKVYEEFMTEQTPSGVKHVELAQVVFKPDPEAYSRFKIKTVSDADKKKAGVGSGSGSVYVPPALRKGFKP